MLWTVQRRNEDIDSAVENEPRTRYRIRPYNRKCNIPPMFTCLLHLNPHVSTSNELISPCDAACDEATVRRLAFREFSRADGSSKYRFRPRQRSRPCRNMSRSVAIILLHGGSHQSATVSLAPPPFLPNSWAINERCFSSAV